MDEMISFTDQSDESSMSSMSNSSDENSFEIQAGHIFFEFILHGVVLNIVGLVRILNFDHRYHKKLELKVGVFGF